MLQTYIEFFLDDDVTTGGQLDLPKLRAARPVGRIAARTKELLAVQLNHLAFKLARRKRGALEGRAVQVRMMMCGEPAIPFIYAEADGETVVQPVHLQNLPVAPFLRHLLARRPDLSGKKLFYHLQAPGADVPAKEEAPCNCLLRE